jgi:hypothetical protein
VLAVLLACGGKQAPADEEKPPERSGAYLDILSCACAIIAGHTRGAIRIPANFIDHRNYPL